MLFQDRQSMQQDFCHTFKIVEDFLESRCLIHSAATRMNTALVIF